MTVGEVVDLIQWAEDVEDEELRKRRQERVKEKLYPKNLSDPHRKRRESLEQKARAILRERRDEKDPMPNMLSATSPLEWQGMFAPENQADLREELAHDGTWAEVEEMFYYASGSPFEVVKPPAENKKKRRKK